LIFDGEIRVSGKITNSKIWTHFADQGETDMGNSFWDRYFQPKPFEKVGEGRIYRLLGVRLYKRYVPSSGDLVSRWRGVTHIQRGRFGLEEALKGHVRFTRNYEARHIFGALAMLVLSWWSITFHGKGQWSVLIAANVLINGYPILLQRYNRVRLHLALDRLASHPFPPRNHPATRQSPVTPKE